MSSSFQEPRVSRKIDAMFSFDSEPTRNTFSVRNRSNEPGRPVREKCGNKDNLLFHARSEFVKQEHQVGFLQQYK